MENEQTVNEVNGEINNDDIVDDNNNNDNIVLQQETENELKEAFDMFDRDNDGLIDKNDLANILKCFNIDLPETQIIQLIKEHQSQTSNASTKHINYDSFKAIIDSSLNISLAEEELIQAFSSFNSNEDGIIPLSQFKLIITQCLPSLSENDLNDIIKEATECSNDGFINYIEFSKKIINYK